MTRESGSGVSRRKFVVASGAGMAAALAGCTSSESTGSPTGDGNGNVGDLSAGGSSTVYPIINTASSYWNGNRPASDEEYWPYADYGIETDKNLAEYWGELYGFEGESGANANPPFKFSVALSHSGTGIEKVHNGQVDIGNASSSLEDNKPDWPQDRKDKFVDHVVGVDGQPLVVSQAIADAGVDSITGDQLKGIYKGEITNWSEVGGPDKSIRVLGRVKGSGTRTSFVSNVWDNPQEDTQVANRFGQNQRLAADIAQSDNAISYISLAFVNETGVEPIALEWEGTTYRYGADENSLAAKEYPLSRDLHCYTYDGTSEQEAAFLNMVLSDFGQDTFVAPNNYFKLSKARQEEELGKLPEPSN